MAPQSPETSSATRPKHAGVDKAPPPLPIVALVGLFIAVFCSTFPSMEVIDQDATMETFTTRVFPSLISLKALGWIRCACAAFCAFVRYDVRETCVCFHPGMLLANIIAFRSFRGSCIAPG